MYGFIVLTGFMRASGYELIVWESLEGWMRDLQLGFHVSGNCMAPALLDGSLVRVRGRARLYPGDVVLVKPVPGAKPYLHRLIGCYRWRGQWRYVTQADNYLTPDAAVPRARLVGKLCGGECAPSLVEVPLWRRCWSLGRFARFALRRIGGRAWRLLKTI